MTRRLDARAVARRLTDYALANLLAEGTPFDEHTPLAEAGLDSFCIVELLLFAEGEFGVRVPEAELTHENLATLATLARCVAALAAEPGPASP